MTQPSPTPLTLVSRPNPTPQPDFAASIRKIDLVDRDAVRDMARLGIPGDRLDPRSCDYAVARERWEEMDYPERATWIVDEVDTKEMITFVVASLEAATPDERAAATLARSVVGTRVVKRLALTACAERLVKEARDEQARADQRSGL